MQPKFVIVAEPLSETQDVYRIKDPHNWSKKFGTGVRFHGFGSEIFEYTLNTHSV